MNKIALALAISISLYLSPTTGSDASEMFYLGGIQVNEPDSENWIKVLKVEQMNTVAVTTYSYQGDWDSGRLSFQKENPGLIEEIRAAKRNGLHAVLILRTALDHAYPKNKFLWHGLIMPETDSELDNWFDQYAEFALHYARIAQQEGVDILGIASEMNSLASTRPVKMIPKLQDWYLDRLKQKLRKNQLLQHQEEIKNHYLWVRGHGNYANLETFLDNKQAALESWAEQTAYVEDDNPIERINYRRKKLDESWRRLIAQVRKVYQGKLTYAANFDQYFEVGFWDALDVMSINAYFPLRKDMLDRDETHLLEEILIKGWQGVFDDIELFCKNRKLQEMPILFSELGYTRRENCSIEPWADTGFSLIGSGLKQKFVVWQDQPESYSERALAIKALHRVAKSRKQNRLMGILYWKLSTLPAHVGIEPFVCILGKNPIDPLLESLQLFSP